MPGDFAVVAGRPAVGKTALLCEIAADVVRRQQRRLAYFSIELTRAAMEARLSGGDRRLRIFDSPSPTVSSIERQVSSLGVDVVMIDYLQLMDLGYKVESRAVEFAELVRALKQMAVRLKVPVVVASQMGYTGISGLNGALASEADLLLIVSRSDFSLNLHVAKNVRGPLDNVTVLGVPARYPLIPEFLFSNFVTGPANAAAVATCMRVANWPFAAAANPLIISGGVGLGKTHLMHAIGNQIQKSRPTTRIRYLSADRFLNGFIEARTTRQVGLFRHVYRKQCDLLLVDDIQILAHDRGIQKELMDTVRSHQARGSQVVMTCGDEPSPEWAAMGSVVSLQPLEPARMPELIRLKAQELGLSLDDETARLISHHTNSSPRAIAGQLYRLKIL